MKKKKLSFMASFLLVCLFLIGCGTEENNVTLDKGRITLQVATTSKSTSFVNGRETNVNKLSFTKGKIKFREVVFDGYLGGRPISITHEQIAVIDYATGTISPSVFLEVDPGEYKNVNLGIEIQDDGSDPSIVIEGTYISSEGKTIPLRFEFNSGEVFEAEAESVKITAGSNIVGKITFDALEWFSVISAEALDNATLTNGVMIISETSNSEIFDQIADRLDVATQAVFM